MKGRIVALCAALVLALPVVKHYEGLETSAYRDPVGIVTICYGHTETAKLGQTKRPDECEVLLERDLRSHAESVVKHVKVDITPNMLAALAVFHYNLGSGNFSRSTLLKKLNNGDYCGAANEFPRWNKAGGRVLKGLIARRKAEQILFLENSWQTCP